MLDLALKLIDRLIDLAKRRGELNRAMFTDFVQPAFQTFEVVHADYIGALTLYGSRLADKTQRMNSEHPVFRDIELDALKSEHLRTKLADFKPVNSPEKLMPFLSAIEFYLKGMSASGTRAEFLDKLASPIAALGPSDLEQSFGGRSRFGDLKSQEAYLVVGTEKFPQNIIFADPMREALWVQLMGTDASPEADVEWSDVNQTLMYCRTDDDRRRVCSWIINDTMRHFQNAYRIVSYAYTKLRSDLISPT